MILREYLVPFPQQKLKVVPTFSGYAWVPALPAMEAGILQVLIFGDTETVATIFWIPILRQALCGYFPPLVSGTQEMLSFPFVTWRYL